METTHHSHSAPADDVACRVCRVVCAVADALARIVALLIAVLCLLVLFPLPAHAAFPPVTVSQWTCGGPVGGPGHGGWHNTQEAAVNAWVAGAGNPPRYGHPRWIELPTCYARDTNYATTFINFNTPAYTRSQSTCPSNSTLVGSQCVCSAGYTENGSSCINSQCQVGQAYTFNRTEGWGRSADADANDLVVDHGPPGFYGYSDGVCVGDIARVDRCWRSQEPGPQGLYRTSCDYTMLISGEASPGSGDSAAAPTTPVPPCPGVLGEFNGKPLCVGTASNPLPPSQDAPNQPTGAGNPSAGVKPSAGPGSGSDGAGRTPATGTGGNDGGPAGAAVGRGGSGPRGIPGQDGENAQAVCGAPPLPACNVKVDETGTPDGANLNNTGQMDGAYDSREAGLATARDMAGDAGWGIIPVWIVERQCEPWEMFTLPEVIGGSTVTLDLCVFKPVADGILNFLWVCFGIFGITGLVASAMTGRES